jgi:hypothetical protein
VEHRLWSPQPPVSYSYFGNLNYRRNADGGRGGGGDDEDRVKYYCGDHIKKNDMGGYVASTGHTRNTYKILVGKPKEKQPRHTLGGGG